MRAVGNLVGFMGRELGAKLFHGPLVRYLRLGHSFGCIAGDERASSVGLQMVVCSYLASMNCRPSLISRFMLNICTTYDRDGDIVPFQP